MEKHTRPETAYLGPIRLQPWRIHKVFSINVLILVLFPHHSALCFHSGVIPADGAVGKGALHRRGTR